MANQTHRVLELMRRFNNNQKVCIESLQNEHLWYEKSEKTIRRDLDIIKEIFPDTFHRIQGETGCYKAITNELFNNITSAENMTLLVQTFNIADRSNLFKNLDIESADKAILDKKIKESQGIYLFKNKPFENKSGDLELFKKLEQAIYHRKEIEIDYRPIDEVTKRVIKPYKIVFMNENFYLASEVDHPDYQFSLFRISKIEGVEFTKRNFHQKRELTLFIKEMQTPMAKYTQNYKEELIDVTVEVAASKAQHFKSKKYLPSQTIAKEKADGSLILAYKVTTELEIVDIIQRWIPHMKVVEPNSLRERIFKNLSEYLK